MFNQVRSDLLLGATQAVLWTILWQSSAIVLKVWEWVVYLSRQTCAPTTIPINLYDQSLIDLGLFNLLSGQNWRIDISAAMSNLQSI